MSDPFDPEAVLSELRTRTRQAPQFDLGQTGMPSFGQLPRAIDTDSFLGASTFVAPKQQAAPTIDRTAERAAIAALGGAKKIEGAAARDELDNETARRLGIPVEDYRKQAAQTTLGVKPSTVTPEIDLTKDWGAVSASPEYARLDWASKNEQRKLWVDANVAELKARMEQRTGKTLKPTDPELTKIRKTIESTTQIGLGKRPVHEWGDSDIVDTAVNQVQSWWSGRKLRDATSDEERQKILGEIAAQKADYQSKLSAYTLDEQKRMNLMREKKIRENVAQGLPPELTMAQEASMGWEGFKSDPYKAVLGNLPATVASIGTSLAGGLVGGIPGAVAAGAATGQELTSAFVASAIADEIAGLSPQALAKSPKYQELLQFHGGDEAKARAAFTGLLVEDSENTARAFGAVTSAPEALIGAGGLARQALGRVAGPAGTSTVARTLAKFGLPSKNSAIGKTAESLAKSTAQQGVLKSAGVAARPLATEAAQEFFQEGGETVIGNVAQQRGGLDTGTFTGAVEAGISGALTGATTAGGVKAGGVVAEKAFGPVSDSGDAVVLQNDKGALRPARSAKQAEQSNLAMDRETGLTRLRDMNTQTDPNAGALMFQLNAPLITNLARQDGASDSAALLAAHGVNSILLAQPMSPQAQVGNQTVSFITGADGKVSVATPAQLTPETQATIDEANRIIETLAPSVTRFASRANGYDAAVQQASVVSAQQPAAVTPATPLVVSTPQPVPAAPPTIQPTGATNAPQIPSTAQIPVGNGPQAGPQNGGQNVQGQTPAGENQTQAQVTAPAVLGATGIARTLRPGTASDNIVRIQALQWIDANLPNLVPAARIPLADQVVAEYRRLNSAAPATAAPATAAPATAAPATAATTTPAPATAGTQDQQALATAEGSVRRLREDDRRTYYQKLRDISAEIKRLITANPVLNNLYVNNPGALPENLTWARLTLGIEVSTNVDTSDIGNAVRAASDPLEQVASSSRSGTANANAAAAVLDMYRVSGIPLPTLTYSDTSPSNRGSYSYGGGAHTVTFNRNTTFTTIPHEYLHGLTAKGYSSMLTGSPEQRDTAALLRHLATLMPQEAYMTAFGNARNAPYEALAELFRPEAVAFMSQTSYDLTTFPADARRAAERLLAAPQGSMFDLFMSTINSILRAIVPAQRLAAVENSLADLMSRVAAETVQATVQRTGGVPQEGAFAPVAAPTPAAAPAPSADERADRLIEALPEELQEEAVYSAIRGAANFREGAGYSDSEILVDAANDIRREAGEFDARATTARQELDEDQADEFDAAADNLRFLSRRLQAHSEVVAFREAAQREADSVPTSGALSPVVTTEPAQSQAQALRSLDTRLPRDLMRAGGRYQQHPVIFARDLDRAAWIARAGQRRASARDADMVAFVRSITGWTEAQVRNHGDQVNQAIGTLARQARPGWSPTDDINLPAQPISTPFGGAPGAAPVAAPSAATRSTASTAAPGGTTPPGSVPAPAAAPGAPAVGEIRQGMSITITAGPRWAGQNDRPFGANGPGIGYTYTVGPITDVAGRQVAAVTNSSASRTVDVQELQARVQSGELGLRIDSSTSPRGADDGTIPGMPQAGPTPPFQFSRNTPQANYRTMPNDGVVARLTQALADRVAQLRMYKSSRYITDGSLPTNVLAASASNDQKMQAYEAFVGAYAAEANRALQAGLTNATDLDAKRAVAFRLFKIRHTNRQGGEFRRGMYLAEIRGGTNGISFVYRSLDGTGRDVASPSMYPGQGTVSYGTTGFTRDSGEGGIHYDAVYGAAVHAGLEVRTSSFTAANQRRMPLNRTRAVSKWGGHFGNFDAATASLMGMSPNSFDSSTEGGAPTAFAAASSRRITLPMLIQHTEQQVMNALHPDARQLGYDFAANRVVVGANREPVADLTAWVKTQSPAEARGSFTSPVSADAVKLLAILRELANNPTADPAVSLQRLSLTEQDALFDRADDQTADDFILDGDDDTDGTDGVPPGGGKKLLAKGTSAQPGRKVASNLMRRSEATAQQLRGEADALREQVAQNIERGTATPAEVRDAQQRIADLLDQASELEMQDEQVLFDRAPGDFQIGQPALPASDIRGVTQALSLPGLSPAAKVKKAAPFLASMGDWILEQVADGLIPTVRWIESLPVAPVLKEALRGAMYLAPNRRDALLERAQVEAGGEDLQIALQKMHSDLLKRVPGVTIEDVIQDAGYWATAVYAKIKNQRMLESDQDAATLAQGQWQAAIATGAPQAEIDQLEAEFNRLEKVFTDRQFALAQPATVNTHLGQGTDPLPVGLAGGFNTAKADEVIAAAERRFGKPALEAMAKNLYKLNAFRMATDITSGRTLPDQAALFSPEIAALMPEMTRLFNASRTPGVRQNEIDAARTDFVNKLAATSKYVPTTGDPDKGFESDVLGSGFKTPNVAKDRRLQGRTTSLAQDGITATLGGMQRSASAAGWNDFTALIEQVYDKMTQAERDAVGMKKVPVTALDRLGDNLIIRNQADGTAVGYSIGDNRVLQALRKENVEDKSEFMRYAEKPTQWFAKAATRWNLPFGPINAIRDVWERSENMRARIYTSATGKRVDSNKAARRMIAIARDPAVLRELAGYNWAISQGKPLPTSRYAELQREFEEVGGGGSKYGVSIARERRNLVKEIADAEGGVIKKSYATFERYINFWNDTFDEVAPLAAYISLREQGMSKGAAGAAALDLMNFRKSGAFMPVVRALYAFAQPTVTGAVNLVNTLKTETGRKRAAGYVVALVALQAILAAVGGDDEETGKSYWDSLDDFAKERSIPLPIPGSPGEFVKLPLGFGLPQVSNLIALRLRNGAIGEADVAETVEAIANDVAQTFTPLRVSKIEDSPIRKMIQTFSPTVATPSVNVAINRGGLGQELVKEAFLDKAKYKAEQGAPLTAEFYKDTAQMIRGTFGMDFAPEEVKELMNTFSLGLLRNLQTALVDNPNKELQGRPTTAPIIGSFVATTDNAPIREAKRFESEGLALARERNSNPEKEFSPEDQAKLELYDAWVELDKAFRARGAALTRAGVVRGVDPERQALSEERRAAQGGLVRQFNEVQ